MISILLFLFLISNCFCQTFRFPFGKNYLNNGMIFADASFTTTGNEVNTFPAGAYFDAMEPGFGYEPSSFNSSIVVSFDKIDNVLSKTAFTLSIWLALPLIDEIIYNANDVKGPGLNFE